ncbi:CD4-2 molecule, tandem duplicate 2 isoform X1 [Pimephales promelas]|uniref:CD4-2 molecule, tandem duplicate 2 isoform X1 n=1 Tax=Pimephales promelas TaxID=90988 RepID=UPI001955A489|nr:CD4-2 molecule, tandem duplicate 2 isoform X1 [Pimephales promelas]
MPTCKILFFLLLALCTSSGKCDELYQQEGGEVSMNCGALTPNSDVEWKLNDARIVIIRAKSGSKLKGNSHVKDKVKVHEGTLNVPDLQKRDYGVYTCIQTGKQYTVHVVSVFASPGPVLVQSSNVELHCEITGKPNAEVQWLTPTNQTNYKKQVIQLKSVTSKEEGVWTCLVKDDLKFSLKLTVVGLLTNDVEVSEGGKVVLPCSLSQSAPQPVVGGKWKADQLPTNHFPTLKKSEDKGLRWNGKNSTKITFTSGQLSTNYDVTLINAKHDDEGEYVCTVQFEGGAELTAKTRLKVEAKPSGGQEVTKAQGKKPAGGGTWTKEVFGLKLWVWIAVGASSMVLIGLVIGIVIVLRRNKRIKKRVKYLRSMRQSLTANDYCQCNRAKIESGGSRQQEKPLPVPRKQRNLRIHPANQNHSFDKSKEQDY